MVNKLNPKSELMTFLGYPQGSKGYLFIRGLNNVLFTATQALFNEILFLKCPDMCHPGYTPVAPPVDALLELCKYPSLILYVFFFILSSALIVISINYIIKFVFQVVFFIYKSQLTY